MSHWNEPDEERQFNEALAVTHCIVCHERHEDCYCDEEKDETQTVEELTETIEELTE